MVAIILIFSNNEANINFDLITKTLNVASKLHFCLVNNGNKDNTLEILNEVKKNSTSLISVLDIKKNKGDFMALKSATRFLDSIQNFKKIQYLKIENLESIFKLEKLINSNFNFSININSKSLYSKIVISDY